MKYKSVGEYISQQTAQCCLPTWRGATNPNHDGFASGCHTSKGSSWDKTCSDEVEWDGEFQNTLFPIRLDTSLVKQHGGWRELDLSAVLDLVDQVPSHGLSAFILSYDFKSDHWVSCGYVDLSCSAPQIKYRQVKAYAKVHLMMQGTHTVP